MFFSGFKISYGASLTTCGIVAAIFGIDFGITRSIASATDVKLLTCTGTQTIDYSPGLTLTPQQTNFTADGSFPLCESSDSTLKSGSFEFKGQGEYTCDLNSSKKSTATYNWNNGKSSTVTFTTTESVRGVSETVYTSIGQVTGGEFVGAKVELEAVSASLEPEQCLTAEGVTQLKGAITLTFVQL
ncbi:MAG: hypothetical protein PUP91_26920 [Rhizonema sp. PD37]|nr:hypothetical protein [Rhizonema sp. PD37]